MDEGEKEMKRYEPIVIRDAQSGDRRAEMKTVAEGQYVRLADVEAILKALGKWTKENGNETTSI